MQLLCTLVERSYQCESINSIQIGLSTSLSSPLLYELCVSREVTCVCFIDISEVFDKVNYWKLLNSFYVRVSMMTAI